MRETSFAVRERTGWPRLFKRTLTGALQYWDIYVVHHATYSEILVEYGQEGTASPQRTSDRITKGKNIGRSNETTAQQQAEAEARSRWEKQVKKGYVEDRSQALAGECDLDGIVPMLAHPFSEHGHKISWPAIVQPKLDGIRCVAIVTGNGVKLYSRTRKLIESMKHIEHELFEIWRATGTDYVFDGELYNHDIKVGAKAELLHLPEGDAEIVANQVVFEEIVSAVRKHGYAPETACRIQYHIYDLIDTSMAALERQLILDDLFMHVPSAAGASFLRRVSTALASSKKDMDSLYAAYMEMGYEGAMVRQAAAAYENRRSYALQKVKEFQDSEFSIVDVKEGRGRMAGHGIFVCEMDSGKRFDCKMAGDTSFLKVVLRNKDEFVGKRLTVQYQGFYSKTGLPRFPVGLRIRRDE
jgi:DNA ligase-1